RRDGAEEARQDSRRSRHGFGVLGHVADREDVTPTVADAATLAHQALEIPLHLAGGGSVLRRYDDRADVAVAGDAPLVGPERHENEVVLVRAHACLALARKDADHFAGDPADADMLAEGRQATEQFRAHGVPDDAHGAAALLRLEEAAPGSKAPVAGDQIVGRGTHHRA